MLLKVRKLCKRYTVRGDSVDALKNVDLDVEEGRFLTVTGPSGSGKSTLLLALGGLMKVTSGEVHFRDRPIHALGQGELAAYRSGHVGFVMQNFSLVPYLSAERNVMLTLALAGADKSTQRARAHEQLARVGLGDRARHLPRELSVGQQQRVAIARALANDPELILADEPTGNLDPDLATHTLDLLEELNKERGLTIIMVTHSPEAAARGNQRVHLVGGQIEVEKTRVLQESLS